MKVVVLAGGKGTRLGLGDVPKVMVPIDGVPLIERTVKGAVNQGFTDFLFLTGHHGDVLERHFGDGKYLGATIDFVREHHALGTAGCFNQVRDRLNDTFIVIYGDVLLDVDFGAFTEFALEKGGVGTLLVHPNDHPFDSDLVEVDANSRILRFHPKPHADKARLPNLVSAALYVLTPQALDFVNSEGASDWGQDVFPSLIHSAPLFAYRSCEYVKDIGTPDRLARAERHLREGRLERLALRTAKPAIFLDRDGVINVERNGVHAASQVSLIPGSAQAIKAFNDAGVPVVCVTNQPDLAKGFMTWDDLRAVTGEIDHQLAEEAGAYLDDILYCPHHPDKGWPGEVAELKIDCDCRKPKGGLLREAANIHNIDLERSWLVGDRYCDVAAAAAVGANSILVLTGHAGADRTLHSNEPDQISADLASVSKFLLQAVA